MTMVEQSLERFLSELEQSTPAVQKQTLLQLKRVMQLQGILVPEAASSPASSLCKRIPITLAAVVVAAALLTVGRPSGASGTCACMAGANRVAAQKPLFPIGGRDWNSSAVPSRRRERRIGGRYTLGTDSIFRVREVREDARAHDGWDFEAQKVVPGVEVRVVRVVKVA